MTEQEIASQIVDKYWKKSGFTEPNPYLLEADIAQALHEARRQENEECARVADMACETSLGHYNGCDCFNYIATAIRERMKEENK